jgi:3'(2'), 5'-bisphosphate nucleotidase
MSEEMTPDALQSLVLPLLGLCRQAGDAILGHYHAPGADEYRAKGDDSPLTRADLDSHAILKAGLAGLAPQMPLLSEESRPAEVRDRFSWPRYWLVDPLDGTKEFLARTGEFTINIALIEHNRPALGVLLLPLRKEAYVGIPGIWARHYRQPSGDEWICSAIGTRPLEAGRDLEVLVSRRHLGRRLDRCMQWLETRWGQVARLNSGSALKFCSLAEGRGDLYPRFSPCSEWDTAAGQALLEAAGGALLGLDGRPLAYNRSESLLSPHFLAIADREHPLWRELLEELRTG